MNDYRSAYTQGYARWGSQQLTAAQVSLAERMGFIRKVYALFLAGIFFAMGGVAFGLSVPQLMVAVVRHPLITFLVMIGAVMGASAVRHVKGVNLVALFGFTALTGVIISPAIYFFGRTNPVSILQAAILTVGIFGGLTAYVFLTRKDFSFLSGMLTTGIIVVILAGLLNIFIASNALGFALAAASLLLFSGYVLYDTSNIIRRYPTNEYIAAALSLYLDAFNIFLALLRLLNGSSRD